MTAKSILVVLSTGIVSALLIAQTLVPRPTAPATPAATKPAEPPLYDEKVDARQQIAAALASAKKENRRVLIQWGGNWCGWCIALHNLYKSDPEISKTLRYEYDAVHVDTGKDGKNVDLAKSYGADLEHHGYPYLTILDASAKPIINQETASLEVKGTDGNSVGVAAGHDKTRVLAFLKKNVATPWNANDLYSQALAQAKSSDRMVFLHFGAPWCGWCHKLEDWMARPEIAALLSKEFVEIKIDIDRTGGAADMEKKLGATGGIPWYVIIDSAGKALITSSTEGDNIGFPANDAEIARFGSMLKRTAHRLTQADIQRILDSLKTESK